MRCTVTVENRFGSLKKLIPFPSLFKQAFHNLRGNDPVRMAGATAFFAFFALPPIVIILSQVLSKLLQDRQQAVSGRLFGQLAELFGPHGARQLQDISRHLQPSRTDSLVMVINVGVLLLSSTTLFAVMKNSLNQLWNVKVKPDRTMLYSLRERVIALAIIVASGLLFTASLTIGHTLPTPESLEVSSSFLEESGADLARLVLSVSILTIWFAMLFTYLPDVRVRWSAIWVGALVTSLLFLLGEALLTRLLTYSQLRSLHGGAGTITIVLLLVFYCSLIFYYGASFTRQYAEWANVAVAPNANAVGYTITEVDEEESKSSVDT